LNRRADNVADGISISKRVILLNSACVVTAQVLNVGILVWLQQFLLARIDVEEYALYPIVLAPMIVVNLVAAALTRSAGRFVVEQVEHHNRAGISEVVSTMLPTALLLAGLLALAGATSVAQLEHLLDIRTEDLGEARLMVALLTALGVCQVGATPFVVGPLVRQRFGLQGAIMLATQVLRAILIVGLLQVIDVRVLWVIVATTVAELAGLVALLLVSMRLIPELRFKFASIRWRSLRRYASFGGWSFVHEAASAVRGCVVPLILNRAATPSDVTYFYLGSLAPQNTAMLARTAVGPLATPLIALHLRAGASSLRSVYVRSSRYALWLATFIALPLIIYRNELITLSLGRAFLPVTTVMTLLLTVMLLRLGNLMLPDLSEAREKMRSLAAASVIHQSLALALTAYLVVARHQGAVGAAAALLIVTAFLQPTVMWTLGRRRAGVSLAEWIRYSVIPAAKPAVAGGVVWLLLRWHFEPSSWLMLGACVAGGATAFFLCLFAFSLQDADRKDLATAVRALARRPVKID